jgi:hypothetical protein
MEGIREGQGRGRVVANVVQQTYFADVATKVLLPMFKARGKPYHGGGSAWSGAG